MASVHDHTSADETVGPPQPASGSKLRLSRSLPHAIGPVVECVGPANPAGSRPLCEGKFLFVGGEKLYLRGVTYGPFGSAGDAEYPSSDSVAGDFSRMAATGINAIRTYTVPPRWLLDHAQEAGLRVLVGIAWEQHIAFLEDRQLRRDIATRVGLGVRACSGHPAVLGYSIGNEIPASLVRWYGGRRIEDHLERLFRAAKEADPSGLVTYVNYPTTEYLELPFLDFVTFNVYLEAQESLEAYLARLQNLAGDRPLVMGEIGLDSRSNGVLAQASTLEWQVRTSFAAGCAGTFVFAWSDEWHRGGQAVEDWDFGLMDRTRRPKPALAAVRRAYAQVPVPAGPAAPLISVVICSYNGARTLGETLEAVSRLEYPDFEVIVIDDGSTDSTSEIAAAFDVRLIRTENRGLSHARNLGLELARGEIVAYLDDDAYPDPHWLAYLAVGFASSSHVGIGGPNLPPAGDSHVAQCVANAPGGPIHVLVSDREAEHIPGCNMAFRKENLEAVGGFDEQFRVAGDDVDLCWRLQERGWTLGFSPAAVVWHHRRNSVRGYWRQQKGYGCAEAMLERKWPQKYNAIGHVAWAGRLYGQGIGAGLPRSRGRIYQGTWGSALFQSVYEPRRGLLATLPMMPEWYLVLVGFWLLALLGADWMPLKSAAALAFTACGVMLLLAGVSASRARFPDADAGILVRISRWGLTSLLHLLQPLARLVGRLRAGLTPWRRRFTTGFSDVSRSALTLWSERWRSPDEWLRALESRLVQHGVRVRRGGDFDAWDLEVRVGAFACVRTRMAAEEHGAGRQLLRFRCSPYWSPARVGLALGLALLAAAAVADGGYLAGSVLGSLAALVVSRKFRELRCAAALIAESVREIGVPASDDDSDGPTALAAPRIEPVRFTRVAEPEPAPMRRAEGERYLARDPGPLNSRAPRLRGSP